MKSIKQLLRLVYINYVFARNGFDQVLVTLPLFRPLKFIIYMNPWNWLRRKQLTRGESIRLSLEELGPIFIKFGQALSTRPDILPSDIASELTKLQDKVPPFSSEQALQIFERSFGKSPYDVFASFDKNALASASMAQVHAATLVTGEDVVVKILRPNMRKVIEKDLAIMHTFAAFLERYLVDSKRLKPKEIVQEFEINLYDELDLQREAANGGQLRRNFHNSPLLYIPEIYWDYTRDNIFVMERIHGIPVTDIAALEMHGVNRKKLAERGVEIFFSQVFRDCFFHADMHPGNIFVSPHHPHDPQYICVDFGIVGTLSDEDKRYLAENMYAFFIRDYRRVAELHVESGWVHPDTRISDFESAIRTVCEPIFEKPLKDISFAQVVLKLFQVARRFHMEVQPQLVLLQKTLLAIEGLGRQLYPELDLWATGKPFLEKWIKEQMGPKQLIKQLLQHRAFYVEKLPGLPQLVHDVLIQQKSHNAQNMAIMSQVKTSVSKKASALVASGVAITLLTVAGVVHYQMLDGTLLARYAIIGAAITGLWAWIKRS
ncbi:ubiquinone biosynthesis regulatory protein kinase UbiB [Legionella sp. W05-934-2]|jgi:ubiquinone biosynthesis protein|uniref:ubiquinone biosynthesis regulatory protein kinase UbiB n=1 Tax=Legionella sp. W05-934-2 TaxID=1198649 RepID=UPI003462BA9F